MKDIKLCNFTALAMNIKEKHEQAVDSLSQPKSYKTITKTTRIFINAQYVRLQQLLKKLEIHTKYKKLK